MDNKQIYDALMTGFVITVVNTSDRTASILS